MHGKGFAHRDVSPRNILVTDSNKAFLIDLGLACHADSAPSPSSAGLAGTLGYVSPEAMKGKQACVASDVWALGCILYEMIYGFSPFLPHEVPSRRLLRLHRT